MTQTMQRDIDIQRSERRASHATEALLYYRPIDAIVDGLAACAGDPALRRGTSAELVANMQQRPHVGGSYGGNLLLG